MHFNTRVSSSLLQCYYDCSLYMCLEMLHYTVIGMLWLCIYPISYYWFPSCSHLFHSVYIVLILNSIPVLGFSHKSCLWCLLLSGLLVCCNSFFLVLYPFCFLHCTSAAAVCSYSEATAGYVCVPSLQLTRNQKEGTGHNWSSLIQSSFWESIC